MMRSSSESRFARGQFGVDQNLVLLTALGAFVAALAFGTINDRAVGKRFAQLKVTAPVQSQAKVAELTALATLPDETVDVTGHYVYRIDYGSSHVLQGDVLIDETTVRRSITINHYTMYGQANYTIEGSTLQYSNIQGDRYLFAEAGTAIGADAEQGTYLEIDDEMKLFIETRYTEDDYRPLVKAPAPLSEQIQRLSVWLSLQLLSLLIAVSILAYVLSRLIINHKKPSRPAPRDTFVA